MGGPGIWGISTGWFLVLYLVLLGLTLYLVHLRRGELATGRRPASPPDPEQHPHDPAYLNGGAALAVCSALTAMHLRGTVTSDCGVVRAAGRPDPGADPLEQAVHRAAAAGAPRRRLAAHHSVCTVLEAARKRLVAAGLLLSEAERNRIRAVGLGMVAATGVALLRVLAGVAEGRPEWPVVVLLVIAAVSAVHLLVAAPHRTAAGAEWLARLREERHELDPVLRPDWAVYGPQVAALGIGIHGTGALWASDPAFAAELALQPTAGPAGPKRERAEDGGDTDGGGCGAGP